MVTNVETPRGSERESDVERRLADLLRTEHPRAYCDECLSVKLAAALDTVIAVALRLARAPGFNRRVRLCYRCWRTQELTELAD